jgi:pimeloyl-ACP methyl ester carboxylesterase
MEKPKILLIHGWNHLNYTSRGCLDAWENRSRFTEALSKHFRVVLVSLPGFGGTKDPEKPWTVDDYARCVGEIVKREVPHAILGYSFGGAVVLRWKKISGDTETKTFLVSPAIMRRYEKKDLSGVQKALKAILPDSFISPLRDLYLTKIRRNPYYSDASKVMRKTYRNIVVEDLRDDLREIPVPVTLIYGENDTATPVGLVQEAVSEARTSHTLHVIPNGGHDIANTDTDELVSFIVKDMGDKRFH